MMDMTLWPLKEEEAVMVYQLFSTIKMQESCDIVTALVVDKLAYWLVEQPSQI